MYAVHRVAIADHVQAVCRPGHIYALPQGVAALTSFDSQLQQPVSKPRNSAAKPSRLEMDVEPDAVLVAGEEQVPDKVFFRIIASRPGRAKTVPLPSASGKMLGRRILCVTLHDAVRREGVTCVDSEAKTTDGGSALMSLSAFCEDHAALCANLQVWTRKKARRFKFRHANVPGSQTNYIYT